MPAYDLPMRKDVSAPRFDEDNPRELASYFEELEYLFEKHGVGHPVRRKHSAVRYVSVDVRELWQCAAAWDDPTRSYEDFKAEVYAFYPETTSAFRYTAWDLDALVNERAQREMQCMEDLGAFYRKFIIISTFLVKKNRLSKLEQARWFLCAFSGDQAKHLRQWLELKYPDAHIDDTPNFVDIFEEAQFVLQRQLHPAHVTGAATPEAHRYPEMRNAMVARAPTAVAFAMTSSTPSTTSSAILAPAEAPLTPDMATEPCQKVLTAFTAIPAAVSTSQATSGPLSDPPPVVERASSQGGTTRDRSIKRSANDSNHTSVVGNASPATPVSAMDPPMGPVVPLRVSANRWVATSTRHNVHLDSESPEMVERKVKALLNRLTVERYESISDQIIAWANKSEQQMDGRTLIQVVKLVFENGTNDEMFSEVYARLCRKIMEQVSPKVQDHNIKNSQGKPFAGGELFRKHLFSQCQEGFERGWVAKETAEAVKGANEKTKAGEESELYWDEYYAANKARRRGLGLIRFLGELFKLQMLTERIMHGCIKKLLANVENPEGEGIESLCTLLTTVGSLLDTVKARAHVDVYFSRMREWTKNKNVNARMILMLQDVIELRDRKWIPRNAVAALTTIAQIHEAAHKEKLAQEKDSLMRQNASMSRGGSRRGGNRDAADAALPDGWSLARPQPKAGDLSQFGKINKATLMTFGPSSIFAGKKGDPRNRDSPTPRTPSTSLNVFSMLQSSDATVEPPVSKGSQPPSRKPSVDLGTGGPPEPAPQRRKLQLLPRTKPVGEESKVSTAAMSEVSLDDETSGGSGTPAMAVMSDEDAKVKVEEDVKEFFGIRMLDEAESYFSGLPTEHRHRLVDSLVTKSIEMKEPDVKLVGDLFVRVREKHLCSPEVFEEGFNRLAELLDDLAVDIPKAWSYFVMLLKGSGLDQSEERLARIAEKTMDPDKLSRLL